MPAPIDVVTLTTRLAAARSAYDRLVTGGMREKVDHNGTSITYTRADVTKLKDYIDELESSLDAAQDPRKRRRMVVNYF